MQPFDRSQRHRQAQHTAAHGELGALFRDRQHLGGLAQGQQPDAIADPGPPATMVAPLRQGPVLLLEAPQPLFALVVAPTRELAFQIGEQFEALGSARLHGALDQLAGKGRWVETRRINAGEA
jgi:hypothetical protein